MTALISGTVPESILSALRQNDPIALTGLPGGSKAFFIVALCTEFRSPLVLISPNDLEAEGVSADLEAWTSLLPAAERPPVIYLPELDEAMRIAALGRWTTEKQAILLCSKPALENPVYSPEQLKTQTFELRP